MLSRFPNKTLKVGAKVSLSPDHTWDWTDSNPVGMCGEVIEKTGISALLVRWHNGERNTYNMCDYDLIAEGEPGYLATE